MVFNKDLNEYQSLEKLIYCWITYFQCWIITFDARKQNVKKVSFHINKNSTLELMPKSVKSKHFRTKADKTELHNYMAWIELVACLLLIYKKQHPICRYLLEYSLGVMTSISSTLFNKALALYTKIKSLNLLKISPQRKIYPM